MKSALALAAMTAFFFMVQLEQAFAEASASPWTVVREQIIPSTSSKSKLIPLELIVEAQSGWEIAGAIQTSLQQTASILSPCNVGLGRVRVRFVRFAIEATDELNNANPYKGPNIRLLAAGTVGMPKPVGFLIDRATGPFDMAKAYNQTVTQTQVNQYGATLQSVLNTFYVSSRYVDNSQVAGAKATYNTLAHELVHLLTNSGHINANDNLMTNASIKSGRLTSAQCQQIARFNVR